MDKPFVGRGWAKNVEFCGDAKFCHMDDEEDDRWDEYDYEDHPDLEYELEKAEYWADCFDNMFEDTFEVFDDMRL